MPNNNNDDTKPMIRITSSSFTTTHVVAVSTISAVAIVAFARSSKGKVVLKKASSLVRPGFSAFASGLGFIGNIALDVFSFGVGGKHGKSKKWHSTLTQLESFLTESGVANELLQTTKGGHSTQNDPVLLKVMLLDKIQDKSPSRSSSVVVAAVDDDDEQIATSLLEDGQKYMRFATSAYGVEMIASARIKLNRMSSSSFNSSDEEFICLHTGVPDPKDIVVADMEYGGSTDSLRHMVVVDHERKAIVLAIRGTFSISEIVTDLEGYGVPFCGGEAHAGMAKMARAVWNQANEAVLASFKNVPHSQEYDQLIVTGHSLGAGVACLITVMLHHEKLLPPHIHAKCFAYAPPPVFHPLEVAQSACDNTVAFVHNSDVVPSLSVNSIRRLFAILSDLDDANKHLRWYQKLEVYFGVVIPGRLMETVAKSRTKPLPPVKGAPVMAIPAKTIVWLKEQTEGSEIFTPLACDPIKFAEWGIYIDNQKMIGDHFPAMYEHAFDCLLKGGDE
eukprot:CAMPEP_0195285420 /NCGR_PEP_ID=MMETSP0707-20130614/3258_1 /TAXON_ID=33640 /ORGANISM="Asterionellopsis glacialis, Strain CCMP134" /LENGTH=503 /DNA_ID=CAMNT_0040344909 /DNA_START=249 /DNA_END=1760 /DNA_ORIENTATION=-